MLKFTPTGIARMSRDELLKAHQVITVKKMHLDKFFSDFLNEKELDHDIPDTPEWKEYKEKLVEYRNVSALLNSANYQLGK